MNVTRMDGAGPWTAIVLTCQSIQNAQAFQTELNLRKDRGDIDKDTILLTVEDPKSQVGSGGATLNALLVVAEHISAKMGYTVVNSDVLNTSLILIVHMGRSFPYDPCGRAFVSLPLIPEDHGKSCESLVCNLDLLLETLTTKFAPRSPKGVWVCSSDMFLQISSAVDKTDAFEGADAVVVAVPGSVDYAEKHGIYKISSDREVENILYQCKSADAVKDCLLPNGSVALVTGVVYLSVRVADRLLACHVLPPLSSCTYMGQDSGTRPIQLSLFFDFMLAMCCGISEEAFVASGPWSGPGKVGSGDQGGQQTVHAARRLIWRNLSKFKVKALLVEGKHSYMDLRPLTHHRHLLTPVFECGHWSPVKQRHSFLHPGADVHEDGVIINSVVESGVRVGSSSVVSNCHLGAALEIGTNSMVSGIIPDDITVSGGKLSDGVVIHAYQIVLPMFHQSASQRVLVVFGINDCLETSKTFCNVEFSEFLSRTGITVADLWDSSILEERRTLMNARLFPFLNLEVKTGFAEIIWLQESPREHSAIDDAVLKRWKSSWRLSLDEILSILDIAGHFEARRKLFFDVASETIRDTLVNCRDFGLNKLFRSAVIEGCAQRILEVLDNVGITSESPGIAARTLASIAEVLGAMSRGEGGLRSGPASNLQWEPAFQLLEKEEIADGFRAMASERDRWLMRPSHIVRAARHYEGAAQILIRHAVMSARKFIRTEPCELVPLNKWVTVECPARIDIAGGWSDTPPITYEHGGAVLDAAIRVNGKNPIGSKVQRIERLQLILHVENDKVVVVSELESLKDYNQPHAPGALLKAAMLCADIVQFPSECPLSEQLQRKYGGGFEVYTWSNLPHGSGLGTSSILAGAVMAALWRASGKAFDVNSLNHAVLHLEQLLTTGGGWQDQVGGLTAGIKVGHSKAELPVKIEMTFLKLLPETVRAFSDRLLLVYTGKTRLARNLLQDVIRNWYARNPEIVNTEDQLVANVWICAKAFEEGNLEMVGKCLSDYWQQKKVMAPGCEPEAVGRMMEALRPHTLGMSMAGAGGGGFLYLLTKEPNAANLVRDILSKVQGTENAEVYDASVNETGLELTIDDSGPIKVPLWFDDRSS